jgi:hypothetical protein
VLLVLRTNNTQQYTTNPPCLSSYKKTVNSIKKPVA